MTQHRIITSPVRLTGSIHPEQLASFVAIDAVLRRRAALGDPPAVWEATTLAGDVAVQRAVERAVAREGDQRDDIGREAFVVRSRQLEVQAAADLRQLFGDMRIQADLDRWGSESLEATAVARVAFVRLYEAGLLTCTDRVLDSCPSCETVVDDADADVFDLDLQLLRLCLSLDDQGSLEIEIAEPELLVGAVAIAVPSDLPIHAKSIFLPLLGSEVPVFAVEGLTGPIVVVPGHDQWSYDLARQLGLAAIEVLDGEGIVRHPGPLEGLGRFAARSVAIEHLTAEGFVVGVSSAVRQAKRCYRCGTALVPLVGRHWILPLHDLTAPVVDAVNGGAVSFSPPMALDSLLEAANQTGAWCVSQQLWSGHPIPVATCLDCGNVHVSVEEAESCGSCMGTLEPHADVLDARFIAAITPLAAAGWPETSQIAADTNTMLSVGRQGLDAWTLPMAALGLWLAGAIPFSHVYVHQLAPGSHEHSSWPTAEMIALVESVSPRVVRAALLSGDFDIERAAERVLVLDNPPIGDQDLEDLVEPFDKALGALDAGGALAIVVNGVRDGVAPGSGNRLASFVRPLLSE